MPKTRKASFNTLVIPLALAAVLLGSPVLANDGDSKFEFHGFLTQAYATANFASGPLIDFLGGPEGSELLLGIPEDGTWDYRNLALQFRYSITDKDIMVFQIASIETGNSITDEFEDEIELDWAFYERRLAANTSVKVGRVQIPYGIYNEIRDVGTILPFYRPPYAIYLEGSFTSETVDGVSLSHTFAADSDWSFSLDVYTGEYNAFETLSNDDPDTVQEVKGKDVFGAQLWLNTPIPGLRFGLAGLTRDLTGGQEGAFREVGEEQTIQDLLISAEGVFDRFSVRGEWRTLDPSLLSPLGGKIDLDLTAWYLQLGFFATEKFHIYLQTDAQVSESSGPSLARTIDADRRTDVGLAINYLFSPNLVLKAEYHEYELEGEQFFPVFTPAGPRLDANVLSADGGDYAIIALSASF